MCKTYARKKNTTNRFFCYNHEEKKGKEEHRMFYRTRGLKKNNSYLQILKMLTYKKQTRFVLCNPQAHIERCIWV